MALFAFSVIFTTFYFYLLVRAILSLTATRAKKEDFPFRKPFTTLMLFSALSLLVTNTLGIVRHHHGTSGTPRAVFVLLVFTSDLATVIIYAGLVLLVLVAYRGLGKPIAMWPATGRGWKRREGLCTKLTTLLLFTMLSASIVRMVIFAAGQNMSQERRRMVFNALYFVFLGVWCALTGIVTGTSVLLWRNRPSRSYSTTSDLDVSWNSLAGLGVDFENNVLYRLMTRICPALIIRILFEISYAIIISYDPSVQRVSSTGLRLASVIIGNGTHFWVVVVALRLGRGGKVEEKGKKRAVEDSGTGVEC